MFLPKMAKNLVSSNLALGNLLFFWGGTVKKHPVCIHQIRDPQSKNTKKSEYLSISFVKSWPTGSVLQNSFHALFHIRLKQIKVRCVKDKRSEKLTPLSSGIHNNRAGGEIGAKRFLSNWNWHLQRLQNRNDRRNIIKENQCMKYLKFKTI